ncbi:MAG: hypothetical protein IPK19_30700 [Chloroflexi bacterium]|nr:hypothetical protein [Chloroflexota bacterium]
MPAATIAPTLVLPTPVPDREPAAEAQVPGAGVSIEALVAGGVIALVLLYILLYWRGMNMVERYERGFIIDTCPVCRTGELHVDVRVDRVLGIPRPNAIVYCDNCRSLLRRTGRRMWRYAVDRTANPMLYGQLNGRVISEVRLKALNAWNDAMHNPPKFEDDSA